ncbi:MAG: glucosidase [Pseudomonadota bacterium]|nr:glucosidase [Pseudomonadota bacterium]
MSANNPENRRLEEDKSRQRPWKMWGPYLSERQWGTVREDYSPDGTAWDYLPHDHARSRTYRWGEDGIAGFSDQHQQLCFGLAMWNGRDPILKERLFGLNNTGGNHGEDVKELYYYLDATPTHSWLKMLYKYPQREFPYDMLTRENLVRDVQMPEYEILDTGIFDDDRYFDVFVEFAKAAPDDILIRISAHNRGPEASILHLIPQLWFRNTWSWKCGEARPTLKQGDGCVVAEHQTLGSYRWYAEGDPELLYCENETNTSRLFGATSATDTHGYFKDAFHGYIVNDRETVVNPLHTGTKAAAHYRHTIPAHSSIELRMRLSNQVDDDPFGDFSPILDRRRDEANEFYAALQHTIEDPESRLVQRQALAGLIWSKQYYHYHVYRWLEGDPTQPAPPTGRRHGRNHQWAHLHAAEIISMPDKWEFPWFATWDLSFHCISLALVDAEFAKSQLLLLTREWYMDRDGELPAYEWALSDANPPVHAWSSWRVFTIDRKQRGDSGDLRFLERVFHKLLINFTWWVNRKDSDGRNLFNGGFLGLDNIGAFDRSAPLPGGGRLDQTDATSWMAMYCLNMMRIALELAMHNPSYQDIAIKFFEHFLGIASAINDDSASGSGLWDDQDRFFYSNIHLPDGRVEPIRARSMVGIIPLFAVETIEPEVWKRLPEFEKRLEWYLEHRPDECRLISRWKEPGHAERRLLALLRGHRMKCVLERVLDETEFLSEFGVRSLSRHHRDNPLVFRLDGGQLELDYQPGESTTTLFGGNSNWRGPVWFPVNFLLIESLQKFHYYYGDEFRIECPSGSGKFLSIDEVAGEIGRRLCRLFLRDEHGKRPVFGEYEKLQSDPHFRDYLLFHEYFHGDTGRGCGASHQTGWTALVAKLLAPRREG